VPANRCQISPPENKKAPENQGLSLGLMPRAAWCSQTGNYSHSIINEVCKPLIFWYFLDGQKFHTMQNTIIQNLAAASLKTGRRSL